MTKLLFLVLIGAAGLWWTRHWGRSPWRWLIWPQIGVMVLAGRLADQGRLPAELWLVPMADKVMHFLLFGAAAFWMHLWLGGRVWRLGGLRWPLALILPLIAATTDELLQAYSPLRSLDLGDWVCNVAGILIFWRLACLFQPERANANEWRQSL